ncbi:hypothetical protein ACFFLM_25250 [Deinococcus oregonensis]|uniref:ATP-grasp domain-containing protein n=1 Tax=Deinococcus oregonensis TaxID=1805970 RepID=A0ABV6B671_9DEIO
MPDQDSLRDRTPAVSWAAALRVQQGRDKQTAPFQVACRLAAVRGRVERRVLVTGARAPVALEVARSFGAAGWQVHVADSVTPFAAWCLRPRVSVHRLPPPRQAFAAFRRALLNLLNTHALDLIVPTCEEVFWLAGAAHLDGWADRLFAPDLHTLRALHSKILFPELARAAGVEAPRTWELPGPQDFPADLPLIFKPEFSRFGVVSPGHLPVGVRPTSARRWAAQERLFGEEVCVWSVAHAGTLTACVVYRPTLRHAGGAAFAFESLNRPEVVGMARAIARAAGATGQLSFDVIITPEGRVAPVECNPRAVSGLHLLAHPEALAEALTRPQTWAQAAAPGTLRYLSPALALLGGAPWRAEVGQTWRAGQDVVGRPGNRAPVVGALLDAARFAGAAAVAGRRVVAQTTADIEWNGEAMQ